MRSSSAMLANLSLLYFQKEQQQKIKQWVLALIADFRGELYVITSSGLLIVFSQIEGWKIAVSRISDQF